MEYEKLITKLVYNYNIFNKDSSIENILDLFKDTNEISIKEFNLLIFIIINEKSYSNFCKELKNIINIYSDEQLSSLFLSFIAIANSDSIEISMRYRNKLENEKELNMVSMTNRNIKLENNYFSCNDIIDTTVELLDFNFKLFKYITNNKEIISSVINYMNIDLIKENNKFLILKTIYEYICFENAFLSEVSIYKYKIEYKDNFHILKHINFLKVNEKLISSLMDTYKLEICYFDNIYIENLKIDEMTGEIFFDIEKKSVKNMYIEDRMKLYINSLVIYHYYYDKNYNDMALNFFKVFIALDYILYNVSNYITDTKHNINFYLFKINKKLLSEYCTKITNLENNICDDIIEYLTYDNKSSFWNKPLIKNGDLYHLLITPIKYGNIIFIIDEYMNNKTTCFKNKKGNLFEKFVIDEITSLLSKKNFFYKIDHGKYKNSKKDMEQIDFILETKNTIIVAEIKCIRYPFNSQLIQRYETIVNKAVDQIIRKTTFLIKNNKKFQNKKISFQNKKIIKCVITNYSLFSGTERSGVYIIDINMLRKYINVGKEGFIKYDLNTGEKHEIAKNLYNTEDEFSNNFEIYFMNSNSFYENRIKVITEELKIGNFEISIPTIIKNELFHYE